MSESYRYRPVLFFLAVYVATWLPWLVAISLASHPGFEGYAALLNLLGLLAPIATSVAFVTMSRSPALKADFRDRLFKLRRIRTPFAVAAVLLPFGVTLTAVWLSTLFGQPAEQFALTGGPLLPIIALTMILAPIMEEVGWHGYGVDSLRAEYGTLKATLLFGVLWSAWDAPLALVPGAYQHMLAGMENPVFLANNRSIAAAILTHSMLNAAAVLINAGQVAKCLATLLYAIIAALLMLFGMVFREGPRNFLPSR